MFDAPVLSLQPVGLPVMTHAASSQTLPATRLSVYNVSSNFLPWLAFNLLLVMPNTSAFVFSSDLRDPWYCTDKEAVFSRVTR